MLVVVQASMVVAHVRVRERERKGQAMLAFASKRGDSRIAKASPGVVVSMLVLSTRRVRVQPLLYTLGVRNGSMSCATNQRTNCPTCSVPNPIVIPPEHTNHEFQSFSQNITAPFSHFDPHPRPRTHPADGSGTSRSHTPSPENAFMVILSFAVRKRCKYSALCDSQGEGSHLCKC